MPLQALLLAMLFSVHAPRAEEPTPVEPERPFLGPDDPMLPLLPQEAAAHAGERRMVCGNVGNVTWASKSRGRPTFINLGRPWPDAVFTIVIWEDVRARFEKPPEVLFPAGRLCVTGDIGLRNGTAQIVVRDPEQISVVER